MNDKHFYLTLPSNSSKAFYCRQDPSDYKTKLASQLSLDPELWEVDVVELAYPKSWYNIPECLFTITYPSPPDPFTEESYSLHTQVDYSGTRYVSSEHLVRDF